MCKLRAAQVWSTSGTMTRVRGKGKENMGANVEKGGEEVYNEEILKWESIRSINKGYKRQ